MSPLETVDPFGNKRRRLDAMRRLQAGDARMDIVGPIKDVPEGMFVTCPSCGRQMTRRALGKNLMVCPSCSFHHRMTAPDRLASVLDDGRFFELDGSLVGDDPLDFPGYAAKLERARRSTGLSEAVVCAVGCIGGRRSVVCVLDCRFLMGSMGVAVGERITRAFEYATRHELPVVVFSASGGARMQEGIMSLMQMAKTAAAVRRHGDAGLPYISVLTDPTTGGVTASFASLGDIILAEPGALIGFAGPRVIEQTIGQKVPEGFQRSESLLGCGFVDAIAERGDLRRLIGDLLTLHAPRRALAAWGDRPNPPGTEGPASPGACSTLTAAERVRRARCATRPNAREYIDALFDGFIELHGDRLCRDDHSIVGGIATFHGLPVTVIGQCKGHDLEENLDRNFGMPGPEGYRKALRLAEQAERFGRPVITLIDTPGAYPGIEAEERGQGEAIARCLAVFSGLTVPVIACLCGEGGSGGALALAVANRVLMLENAIYSVLSPEGFAAILWKDRGRSDEAAEVMKLTADDLLAFGVVDRVVSEPEGGAQDDPTAVAAALDEALRDELSGLLGCSGPDLAAMRYRRFRAFGDYRKYEGRESD